MSPCLPIEWGFKGLERLESATNDKLEKITKADPTLNVELIWKLLGNIKDSINPQHTIDREFANPLWILSEYFTTNATT